MQFSLEAWKKKRRKSMLVYLFWGISFGIDYSMVLVTLIPYLRDLVKTSRYQFYYGLCVCLYYAVATISGVIITRIVDRTRKVKLAICVCLTLAITGNLIYTVYLSPIFLLIGRALVGINDAVGSLVVGEIIRTYEVREGTQAQWWFIAACSIGYSSGSWISLAFTNVNLTVGSTAINSTLQTLSTNKSTSEYRDGTTILDKNNFTGLFLSCIHFMMLLFTCFFAHDCSNEYDLKTILHEQQLSEIYVVENKRVSDLTMTYRKTIMSENGKQNPVVTSIRREDRSNSNVDAAALVEKKVSVILNGLLHQPDAVIILASSFLFSYTAFTLDLLIPIIIVDYFKWTAKLLSVNYSIHSVVYFFAILICSKVCTTNKRVFSTNVFAIISTIITLCLILSMRAMVLTEYTKIIMISLFQISYVPVWFLDEVTQSNLLSRIVESDIQSFAEAIRSGLSKSGCILASLIIAANVDVLYCTSIMIALCLVSLISYSFRARRMINLQISEF